MLLIAHRGCSYPRYNQNTLRAFDKVISQGVDAVELDVQKSADDVLLVVHNLNLEKVSTGKGLVSETDSRTIKRLFAGDPSRGEDRIPLLEEVMELFASVKEENRPVMHLELKGKGTGRPAGEMIKTFLNKGSLRMEDFLVSSFNWKELENILASCPGLKIALLDGAIRREELIKRLPESEAFFSDLFAYGEEDYMLPRFQVLDENLTLLNKACPLPRIREELEKEIRASLDGGFYNNRLLESAVAMRAVSVNLWYRSLNKEFVEKAHNKGLSVLVYTVNDPEELKEVAAMGVDGIFTDFYEQSKQVLKQDL